MDTEGLRGAKVVRRTGDKRPTKVSFALLVKNPTGVVRLQNVQVVTDGGPSESFPDARFKMRRLSFRLKSTVAYALFLFSTEDISAADDATDAAPGEDTPGSDYAEAAEAHGPPPAKRDAPRTGGRITVTTTNTTPATIEIPLEGGDVLEE